jgi:hypothetical protein
VKPIDIALICAVTLQCAAGAVGIIYNVRPQWIARMATDAFLIRHSLWDECDGEPMNVWAEEFVRRDELSATRAAQEGESNA